MEENEGTQVTVNLFKRQITVDFGKDFGTITMNVANALALMARLAEATDAIRHAVEKKRD